MKMARDLGLVLVTAPDLKTGRKLVKHALDAKLVACGNIVPGIESHYWWQGKLERSREVLIIFKATARSTPLLEKLVLDLHPYDTPEVVFVPVTLITQKYMQWWRQEASAPE